MSDPFLAQIVMFGGNFAPRGWALCDGQILPISQYSAVFSLLGTIYGGDGRTTFALPDLRGRLPMHPGNGPGLTPRSLGQKAGTENVTLTTNQIAPHSHAATLSAASQTSNTSDPSGHPLATAPAYESTATPATAMHASSVTTANTGGGQGHTNVQPFTCVNFIIALQGTFPSRN